MSDENKSEVSPNVKYVTKAATVVLLSIIGLTGLYFHVEYSGWLIFIAVLTAM